MLPPEFHFLRPYWLLAFIPLVLLVTLMMKRRLRNRKWESFCDRALLPHILIGNEPVSRRISSSITALAGSLVILSLAGPTWQKLPQPVFSSQSALVIALDLSRSMNATDISPSRIERARYKVADILEQRAGGETALLVYAGDAFTVTPLTDDAATIQSQLMALTTEIMPAQGNRTDVALSRAVDLLQQAGATRGDILLITDEIDPGISLPVAKTVRSEGYRLSILAIGTSQGAPITLGDGSFFKDPSGQIVIPKLNEAPMRELVDSAGGRYQKMTVDDTDVTTLVRFFESNHGDDDVTETDFETDVWAEEGPWLLLLVIPLAAMAFRRGVLLALLVFCLPVPRDASALDWDSIWLRDDQRAEETLEQGNPARAAELFKDPAWKGAAYYRAEDYDAAIQQLQGAEGIENRYNLGNAMARKGLYEQAIALYDEVLEQDPGHEDARYNKELLEKELEEQQQQQQQATESYSDENQPQQEQQQDQQQQQQQQQQAQQQKDQQDPSQQDQQMQETEQQDRQAEQQQPDEQQDDPGQPEPLQASNDQLDEEQQATEQWLRRIPDDPGGLLRRKFLLQYQQRQHDRVPGEKSW